MVLIGIRDRVSGKEMGGLFQGCQCASDCNNIILSVSSIHGDIVGIWEIMCVAKDLNYEKLCPNKPKDCIL